MLIEVGCKVYEINRVLYRNQPSKTKEVSKIFTRFWNLRLVKNFELVR